MGRPGRGRLPTIPVDKIKVINSRNRDQEQFAMNTESIDHTGLLKPVRVNDKFRDRTGMCELICGEGRLLAHQRLGHETILAEVERAHRDLEARKTTGSTVLIPV